MTAGVPIPATDYAGLLIQIGDQQGAETVLRRVEEFVSFFRQQGYSTAVLDWMDARVHLIRGEREPALESLAKTAGRQQHWYPLECGWMLQSLSDDTEFQRIVSLNDEHKAEQLELLREHHKNPRPWSPDYQGAN